MPKTTRSLFVGRHPARHLVVGRVPVTEAEDFGTPHLRHLKREMAKLLDRLGLAGDYFVEIVRASGAPEIHAEFSERSDADRLASVVHAAEVPVGIAGSPSEVASQQQFILDDATAAAITASLAMEGELDER